MSPEVNPTDSLDEESNGPEAESGNREPTSKDTGSANDTSDLTSADLSDLLPENQDPDVIANEGGIERDDGEDNDSADMNDPEIVPSPTPTSDQAGVTPPVENLVTVTTGSGYTLRKRSSEQLAAMRPDKRTRRSVRSVETGEIDCIDNRRTVATGFEYRVTWVDGSDPMWLPRDQLIEDGNANLVETFDAYLLRYPNREQPYQAYISRNARAFSAVADREDNTCLPHAIQMALELLGHRQESARLPEIWEEYLRDAIDARIPLNEGFHKLGEIVRYCSSAVPRCGVELSIKTLRKNLYDGEGAGPMAIVRRVLPDDKGVRVLKPGVYLVGAYKRNMRAHCFAMEVTADEDIIVRENGIDSGIGDQMWLRMIKFIRRIKTQQNED